MSTLHSEEHFFSGRHKKALSSVGPNGDPMATLSI